jgi:hypothetical protein
MPIPIIGRYYPAFAPCPRPVVSGPNWLSDSHLVQRLYILETCYLSAQPLPAWLERREKLQTFTARIQLKVVSNPRRYFGSEEYLVLTRLYMRARQQCRSSSSRPLWSSPSLHTCLVDSFMHRVCRPIVGRSEAGSDNFESSDSARSSVHFHSSHVMGNPICMAHQDSSHWRAEGSRSRSRTRLRHLVDLGQQLHSSTRSDSFRIFKSTNHGPMLLRTGHSSRRGFCSSLEP